MNFKNIVIVGGGVLGSQIAFQSAYCGYNVKIWLRSEDSIGRAKPKIERLKNVYKSELEAFKGELGNPIAIRMFSKGLYERPEELTVEKIDELILNVDKAFDNIEYILDLDEAFNDADLVIEAMAENPEAKINMYKLMQDHLPAKTVICTNSSTLLPSAFADYTGRPEKYLALHFANNIWKMNLAEVMGHKGTEQKYYDEVVEFAKSINMVPSCLKKEQAGYILNSMLVPLLESAEMLYAKGIADPETIDNTWMLATGAPHGPFRILDIIGLTTAYNVIMNHEDAKDENSIHGKIAKILKDHIDKGELGLISGKGFYDYK